VPDPWIAWKPRVVPSTPYFVAYSATHSSFSTVEPEPWIPIYSNSPLLYLRRMIIAHIYSFPGGQIMSDLSDLYF
jgi:hypothetical protein